MLATKIRISCSTSLRQAVRFVGVVSVLVRPTSRNQRFVSRSSLRQFAVCEGNLCVIPRLPLHHDWKEVTYRCARVDPLCGSQLEYLATTPLVQQCLQQTRAICPPDHTRVCSWARTLHQNPRQYGSFRIQCSALGVRRSAFSSSQHHWRAFSHHQHFFFDSVRACRRKQSLRRFVERLETERERPVMHWD